jgi:hypothetical protein
MMKRPNVGDIFVVKRKPFGSAIWMIAELQQDENTIS